MGCCKSKDAVTTEQEPEGQNVLANDSSPSPAAGASEPALKPTSESMKGNGSNSKNNQPTDSGGSTTQPADNRPAENRPAENRPAPPTPSGAVPITKKEAPPPGWGRTPEVEEIEVELEEPESGPRDIESIPGGNGYVSGTRKDQKISEGVMDRIKGLEDAGLQTKKKLGLKMLTPRIITDIKETWDLEGNVTRYMTHYIEEPDGRKHTTKETLYIAAGDPDPMAPESAPEDAPEAATETE